MPQTKGQQPSKIKTVISKMIVAQENKKQASKLSLCFDLCRKSKGWTSTAVVSADNPCGCYKPPKRRTTLKPILPEPIPNVDADPYLDKGTGKKHPIWTPKKESLKKYKV